MLSVHYDTYRAIVYHIMVPLVPLVPVVPLVPLVPVVPDGSCGSLSSCGSLGACGSTGTYAEAINLSLIQKLTYKIVHALKIL